MIMFLKSVEFLAALVVLFIALRFFNLGDISNYVQVSSIFGWAYTIHLHHRHGRLLKDIRGIEE